MKRLYLPLVFLILTLTTLAAAPSQTPLPPGGTPTPVPFCLPDLQETCAWASAVVQTYGLWVLVLVILLLIAIWFLRRGEVFLSKLADTSLDKISARDEAAAALSAQERAYLEHASKTYRHFKFRGLPRVRAQGIEPPELDQAYISVRMTAETVRGEKGDMKKRSGGEKGKRRGTPDAGEFLEGRLLEAAHPVDLAEALQQSPRLAIIGVAGSGKSTLLQWAGLACARARLAPKTLSTEQRRFITTLNKPPLPIFLSLRSFDEYCKDHTRPRTARTLLDFMAHHFTEKQSSSAFTVEFFQEHLRNHCLLMLDGVDEVDPVNRLQVREAVEGLLRDFDHPGLRCLITSRPSAAYIPDQMSGFRQCTVQRLEPTQRDDLIRFWYRAVLPHDENEAANRAGDLSTRIQAADARVGELATTPLMVTIFAMLHYSRDELPRQRAKLYEEAIEVLLTEVLFKEGKEAAGLRQWGGMEWEPRRDRLARIAFELHLRRVSFLLEDDLVGLIWSRFGAEESQARREARGFLQMVAERGGLLEERDLNYGFYTHQSFQEYLAGRYLVEEYNPDDLPGFLEKHLNDDQWEEAIRLAAGYLAIKGEGQANRFILSLAGLGLTDEDRTHALTLAGLALSDLPTDRVLPETRQTVTGEMLARLVANPPLVSVKLRARLGRALAHAGDPRFSPPSPLSQVGEGPGVRFPALVPIPAGTFQMGTSEDDERRLKEQNVTVWDDEKPAHLVTLSEFWIGKYPVTNAEFRYFWDAKGYDQQALWSADGWRWRTGQWESDLSVYSEDSQKSIRDWLARRPVERRDQPFFWDDLTWNLPNLPVVGVCWFEAEAYTHWLRALTGEPYRLPTEAEWEKAARWSPSPQPSPSGRGSLDSPPHVGEGLGVRGNLFPWGDVWDAAKCNNTEAEDKIGRTSPVGMYPDGASPCGALDMAGNVWEWCADWFADDEYAKRPPSGIIDPHGPETGQARVVRGGCWNNNRDLARSAVRNRGEPDDFDDDVGFRVVRSPTPS